MWSPWAGVALIANSGSEAVDILASNLSQPLEGSGLRVIYLVERVCCQLAGEDVPQVPVNPLVFMLASHSITAAEYAL